MATVKIHEGTKLETSVDLQDDEGVIFKPPSGLYILNKTIGEFCMKKIFLATAMIAVIAIASCGSTATATTGADELDIAIREASDYLNGNVPNGNKIVILNIQSSSADLSNYVIDEMIANAVNDKIFSVVDRAQLDLIREEQKIQYSGEVDDNAALEIGKFLGAQTIVSGAISKLGNGYRMRIRALDVLTAQVQGQFNRRKY